MYQHQHMNTIVIQTSWVPKCEWQWKLPSLGHIDSKLKCREGWWFRLAGATLCAVCWPLYDTEWHQNTHIIPNTALCMCKILCACLNDTEWHQNMHILCTVHVQSILHSALWVSQSYSFTLNCAQYELHEFIQDMRTILYAECSPCTHYTHRNHKKDWTLSFCLYRLIYDRHRKDKIYTTPWSFDFSSW